MSDIDNLAAVLANGEPTRFARFKNHLKENKPIYIGAAVGVAGLVGGAVISRRNPVINKDRAIENFGTVTQLVASGFKTSLNNHTHNTTIINEEPVKRLSYIIRVGEQIFETQREAAEALGVSEVNLSKFLNGKTKIEFDEIPVRLGVRS